MTGSVGDDKVGGCVGWCVDAGRMDGDEEDGGSVVSERGCDDAGDVGC